MEAPSRFEIVTPMAHATQTREELVKKLTAVFRTHGYEGATLARLSEASGLVKASLYYQFPRGKEDMAEAILQSLGGQMKESVLAPLAEPGPARERFTRMAEGLAAFYHGGGTACVIDVFGIGTSRDLFGTYLAGSILRLGAAIATVLRETGFDAQEATRRAEDALIAIQGALVIARASQSTAPFERTIKELPGRLLRPET